MEKEGGVGGKKSYPSYPKFPLQHSKRPSPMTIAFSAATPVRSLYQNKVSYKPNSAKPLLCSQDDFRPTCNVVSWTASANYVSLRIRGARIFQAFVKLSFPKRKGIVRCATIEEIEAAKSSIEKDVKERMEKTVENVKANFNSIRAGRASPAMLDKIEVDYYGVPVSLKSIAQVSTPDASSLLVQPYDKSSLKAIEKAIVSSHLGITPNNDGEVIRLAVPQLTSDRRKELSKVVSKQAEEGKVAIRNIRREALKAYEKLEKEKKLSEDNVKDLSGDLQKLTDEYMKKIDAVFKQKEKELLTV